LSLEERREVLTGRTLAAALPGSTVTGTCASAAEECYTWITESVPT
jgi:hypothetical protein